MQYYVAYVKNLKFEDTPDYDYLLMLFNHSEGGIRKVRMLLAAQEEDGTKEEVVEGETTTANGNGNISGIKRKRSTSDVGAPAAKKYKLVVPKRVKTHQWIIVSTSARTGNVSTCSSKRSFVRADPHAASLRKHKHTGTTRHPLRARYFGFCRLTMFPFSLCFGRLVAGSAMWLVPSYAVLHVAHNVPELGERSREKMGSEHADHDAQLCWQHVDCSAQCEEQRVHGAGAALLPRSGLSAGLGATEVGRWLFHHVGSRERQQLGGGLLDDATGKKV